jgi:hypothetical protein
VCRLLVGFDFAGAGLKRGNLAHSCLLKTSCTAGRGWPDFLPPAMIHAHSPHPQAAKVLSSNHNSALAMILEFLTLGAVSYIIIFGYKATEFFITQGQKAMGKSCVLPFLR